MRKWPQVELWEVYIRCQEEIHDFYDSMILQLLTLSIVGLISPEIPSSEIHLLIKAIMPMSFLLCK